MIDSAAPGCFDGCDVDLFHPHHRLEDTFGDRLIGIGDGGYQHAPKSDG